MSFEGYYQILCKNGHLHCPNVYDIDFTFYEEDKNGVYTWKCPVCKEEKAWENLVDTTNGSWEPDSDKRIDGYVELEVDKKETCTCSNCGDCHIVGVITYKIPKDDKKIR